MVRIKNSIDGLKANQQLYSIGPARGNKSSAIIGNWTRDDKAGFKTLGLQPEGIENCIEIQVTRRSIALILKLEIRHQEDRKGHWNENEKARFLYCRSRP